jgi:pyrimidine operon attenuation protein/uracil phosphoribosyltransferase
LFDAVGVTLDGSSIDAQFYRDDYRKKDKADLSDADYRAIRAKLKSVRKQTKD